MVELHAAADYAWRVDERPICLECGLPVGALPPYGCLCPPPSLAPRSLGASSHGPYRSRLPTPACPRCTSAMRESSVHEALVLDCSGCGGVFVSKSLIEALDRPEGRDLRVAFPPRPRMAEPTVVRYLACPVCDGRMNRTSFARGANVVVDVCKEDGIWFDAGEVHAVLDFVEGGGLERARRRAAQDRVTENKQLRDQWKALHEEAVRDAYGRHNVQPTAGERQLVDSFFGWLRR